MTYVMFPFWACILSAFLLDATRPAYAPRPLGPSLPTSFGDSTAMQSHPYVAISQLTDTKGERIALEDFDPPSYSLDGLTLAVGDRVTVTHNPLDMRQNVHRIRGGAQPFVFGYNHRTRQSGWFPLSQTSATGGSLIEGPSEECRNTYFSDWGSSGMKVFKVHVGDERHFKKASEKLTEVRGDSDSGVVDKELTRVGNALISTKRVAEHSWRILATAGMRLRPKKAQRLWDYVRLNMTERPPLNTLLAQCNVKTDRGCRTLPGSTEALYEMGAAYMGQRSKDFLNYSTRGFVSAGGASLQVGIVGLPREQVATCRKALTAVWIAEQKRGAKTYDAAPTRDVELPNPVLSTGGKFPDGTDVFLFSFLAIGGELRTCEGQGPDIPGYCDHKVGGINEMRKQFESYLKRSGRKDNPCIEKVAEIPLVHGSDVWSLELPGSFVPEHDLSQCYGLIDSFLSTDLSLEAWQKDCYSMTKQVQAWGFMTSFRRATPQLTHDDGTHKPKKFCSEEDVRLKIPYTCGEMLSNGLLVRFLHKIGYSPNAQLIEEVKSDWVDAPMALYGLKDGWCPEPGESESVEEGGTDVTHSTVDDDEDDTAATPTTNVARPHGHTFSGSSGAGIVTLEPN